MKLHIIAAIVHWALATPAEPLPCLTMFAHNDACSDEMLQAEDDYRLAVEVNHNEIFGKEWVAGVSVDGKTATQHHAARGADGKYPLEGKVDKPALK